MEDRALAHQAAPQGDGRAARRRDVGTHVLQRGLLRLRRCAVRGRTTAALHRVDGKTFDALVDSIPHYHATPETRLACPDERKFEVIEELKRTFEGRYRIIDIDGVRVEFGDGWGLARASNTQPAIVVRFEAKTPERLEQIRAMFLEPLRKLGVGEAAVSH